MAGNKAALSCFPPIMEHKILDLLWGMIRPNEFNCFAAAWAVTTDISAVIFDGGAHDSPYDSMRRLDFPL
jgi:hypothetical protein